MAHPGNNYGGNVAAAIPFYVTCRAGTYFNSYMNDKTIWSTRNNSYRGQCVYYSSNSIDINKSNTESYPSLIFNNDKSAYRIIINSESFYVLTDDFCYKNRYGSAVLCSLGNEDLHLDNQCNNLYGFSRSGSYYNSWFYNHSYTNFSTVAQTYITDCGVYPVYKNLSDIKTFYKTNDLDSNTIFEYVDIHENTFSLSGISTKTINSNKAFGIYASTSDDYNKKWRSYCSGLREITFSYKTMLSSDSFSLYSVNGNSLIGIPSSYEGCYLYSRLNFEKFIAHTDISTFGYFLYKLCYSNTGDRTNEQSIYLTDWDFSG